MKSTSVPWQEPAVWNEVDLYFRTLGKAHGKAMDPVRDLALAVRQSLENLSGQMDRLCSASCPECRDICCERALIWYDFKDLVYHYLAFDCLPGEQIRKISKPNQGSCCSRLAAEGCSLPRSRRPFVCTWYVCPAQKSILQRDSGGCGLELFKEIERVKGMRNRMEEQFCRISVKDDFSR